MLVHSELNDCLHADTAKTGLSQNHPNFGHSGYSGFLPIADPHSGLNLSTRPRRERIVWIADNSRRLANFNPHFRALSLNELSAAQRKPALLADGLISPKLDFIITYNGLSPEFAGYGVHEVVPQLDMV